MRTGSKIISRLDVMLEAAINGSFVESDYDETELSRLESGMVELSPTEGLLYPLLSQAVNLAKGRAGAKGITIELAGEETNIRAVFDFRWTLEAMGNLLDNAVKYSPAGSTVIVRLRVFEMFVCVSVEDMGPGIPESEQAQIFERFYRGKHARHEEGNGVGLYLTRMILQKERGYVKVVSREERGSCFSIYLQRP